MSTATIQEPSLPAPSEQLKILVVEDYADAAESAATLFRMAGHEVQTAYDGLAAIKAARSQQPDVVLLDIGLPGVLDGWAVAKQLRQEAGAKRPFFVAITGYGQEEDHRRSKEAGIDLHLLKPVNLEQISQLLQRFKQIVY